VITSGHQRGIKYVWTRAQDGMSDFRAQYHSARRSVLCQGGAVFWPIC